MKELVWSLSPLIGIHLLALVAALFLHIQTPGRGVVKMLVVPLTLGCLLASPLFFVRLMGYSVSWPLPDKFTFIAYQPVVKAGRKTALEIWLQDGNQTRLQRAPYRKELEQMLKDAQDGSKGGRQARVERKAREKGKEGQETTGGEYELRFESPADLPKESGEPPAPVPITKRYSV